MTNEPQKAEEQAGGLKGRNLEAMAFTRAAQKLEDAKALLADDPEAFDQAVRLNNLLWTIIQADITEPANHLPPEIKANIMSLSIFVDKQTTRALASRDGADLDSMIRINRNLASGLWTSPDGKPLPVPGASGKG